VRGNQQALDDGIAEIREQVMPAVQALDGFVGLSMLVDRESGRCIVTTAWDSERALRDSRDRVQDLRTRTTELIGGEDPQVEEWEIALLHRERPAGDSAHARVTWLQGPAHEIDHNVDVFRNQVLPRLEEVPGFCSASLLVNRDTGRASTAVTYDSRESLEQSRETARSIRDQAMRSLKAEIHDIAELELAVAHLGVPEKV
jgi:heme-degrading monooxygenase HmoA